MIYEPGKDATYKIYKLREWIKKQPPSVPSYSKAEPTPAQMHIGTLVTSLSCVGTQLIIFANSTSKFYTAYTLNMRGSDIPFNPLFHGYLYVGLNNAIVFIDSSKVQEEMADYLASINVERRDYTELWSFLRKREWGEGKVRQY